MTADKSMIKNFTCSSIKALLGPNTHVYLLIELDVDLALLSAAANQQ